MAELTNTHVRLAAHLRRARRRARGRCSASCRRGTPPGGRSSPAPGWARRRRGSTPSWRPALSLRTPVVHAAVHDPSNGDFTLLLEDLTATGCSVSDGTVGVRPDSAARAWRSWPSCTCATRTRPCGAAEAGWVEASGPGSDYAVADAPLRHGAPPGPAQRRVRRAGRALQRAPARTPGALAPGPADRRPRRPAPRQRVRRPRPDRVPRLGDRDGQHADAGRQLLPHHGHGRRGPAPARGRPAAPLPRRPPPSAAPMSASTRRGRRTGCRPPTPCRRRARWSPSPPT